MSGQPPLITRDFLLLVSGHFLQALGFSSMTLLPLYLGYLHASRAEIGTIMAIASIGGLTLRPVVGWALDAIGRRPTVFAGTICLVTGMGLIGGADRLGPLLYIARLLIGVGGGTLFGAYFTFAADLIPVERRTEGIALFGVSGLTPLAFSGLVDEIHIAPGELRWLFPILGALVLFSLVPVRALAEPPREPAPPPEAGPPVSLIRTLWVRPLRAVWLATIVFSAAVAVFMTFITVIAANRGVEAPARVWLTYAVGAVVVRLVGARLPERVGDHNMVAPSLGLYAGSLLISAAADTSAWFMVAGLLAGMGHGYCFPVLSSMVVSRSPRRVRGAALAAFTGLWELTALICAPLFGLVADRLGDATMLTTVALCAAVGLAAWIPGENGAHRALRESEPSR